MDYSVLEIVKLVEDKGWKNFLYQGKNKESRHSSELKSDAEFQNDKLTSSDGSNNDCSNNGNVALLFGFK